MGPREARLRHAHPGSRIARGGPRRRWSPGRTRRGLPTSSSSRSSSRTRAANRRDRSATVTGHPFSNFERTGARQITRPSRIRFRRFREGCSEVYFVCMTVRQAVQPSRCVRSDEPEEHPREVGSNAGMTNLRSRDREYAHVTYFFNGGREIEFPGEDRIMILRPRWHLRSETGDERARGGGCPRRGVAKRKHDYVVSISRTPTMVGHSGSSRRPVKAVEAVDACVGRFSRARSRARVAIVTSTTETPSSCGTGR